MRERSRFPKPTGGFRNALVRANYNNYNINIRETTEYLECFLRNLLLGEKNMLRNRDLHISATLGKQDGAPTKQGIEISDPVTAKTKSHIEKLLAAFGHETVFGRTDVMKCLGLTASPASELLKKMLGMELIEVVAGQGKGKYVFRG